ncbi:helix-turn-helix domain-containing protein [Paenibacillus terrigena]|uniref:TetR/AcrR family transcriptional regulator n=1 Tax=Paenibacillus terrigena TaxID=369333 RepID=UPI0028D24B72|nr:helix-turn-helix domain-containing protein [Paenibacillus terrigena]
MAEKIHDQMVERTRQLIKETLIRLIEEKGFSNVTVRDLTLHAKINRGTFYRHYLDKYDLLEQLENELLLGLQQHMHTLHYQEMLISHEENKPHFPLVEVFRYLKQKGPILKALLGAKGDPAFSQKMKLFLEFSKK